MSTDQTANLRFDLNRQICRFSHLQQLHMAKMTSRQLALSGYRQDSEHVWMLHPPRAPINEPEEGGGGQISRRSSPRTGLIHKQNLRSFLKQKTHFWRSNATRRTMRFDLSYSAFGPSTDIRVLAPTGRRSDSSILNKASNKSELCRNLGLDCDRNQTARQPPMGTSDADACAVDSSFGET